MDIFIQSLLLVPTLVFLMICDSVIISTTLSSIWRASEGILGLLCIKPVLISQLIDIFGSSPATLCKRSTLSQHIMDIGINVFRRSGCMVVF